MNDGTRILSSSDVNNFSSTRTESLGAVGSTGDGRLFRYVGFGGTSTINAGVLVVSAALSSNSTGLALNSANSTANLSGGSYTLYVTNGSTAVTQDQFAGGFVEVLGSNGNVAYKLNGNTAAAASGVIALSLAEPLTNTSALVVGTNTVNLTASPYANVAPSATASRVVGVTRVAIPNTSSVSNYGWVQVTGHCLVTAGGAVAKGAAVSQDTTTAGQVITNASSAFQLGQAKEAISSGAVGPVDLRIG